MSSSRRSSGKASSAGRAAKARAAAPTAKRAAKQPTKAAAKRPVRATAKRSAPGSPTKVQAPAPKPPPPQAAPRISPLPARPKASIRLPGPGSSRLTIKPGPAGAVRAQLVLSTKPRPSGSRRLSEVELDEDEVLIDAFNAMLDGVSVRITAVLERTCVYVDRNGDRRLARKFDLWVEADKLPIRRRGIG